MEADGADSAGGDSNETEYELAIGPLTMLTGRMKNWGTQVSLQLQPRHRRSYTVYQNVHAQIGRDSYEYSEAWTLNTKITRALNGANAQMMAAITGNTPHQEASARTRTFDIVMWIRARRLQWLGHILRMGRKRLLKRAIYEMLKERQEGDMLMDAPSHNSWRELCTYAIDRDYWRARVRSMKQPRIRFEGPETMEGGCNPFTIST